MSERFGEHSLLGAAVSSFRPDTGAHVAQQSRRDKLRYPHHLPNFPAPAPPTNLLDPPHADDHPSVTVADLRNCTALCDVVPSASMYSSGQLLDFSVSHVVPPHQQQPTAAAGNCDWMMNYMSGGESGASWGFNRYNHQATQHPVELPYGSLPFSSLSSSSNQSMDMPPPHVVLHQNLNGQVEQTGPSWVDAGAGSGIPALLPGYGPSRVGNPAVSWMEMHQTPHWTASDVQDHYREKTTQGLSLSLSSSQRPPELPVVETYHSMVSALDNNDLKPSNPEAANICSYRNFSPRGISSAPDNNSHGIVGPLGPFTGYAAILQSSKFLKPAQQLLDDSCNAAIGPISSRGFDVPRSSYADARTSGQQIMGADSVSGGRAALNSSATGPSSSLRHGSTVACEEMVVGDMGGEVHLPAEIQEKKAKLLFLQGEVCRRYKQYNQQIQMAISSFESVAGLSAAIPFMSSAVKTVSRHFRFLKTVISEQLIHVSRVLGEDFSMTSSRSYNCESVTSARLKFLDQTLRRQKAEESGLVLLENTQPVWRPQRGLPERAVAVLRAWLFDHFLHPYPTDTDKLMLATQTGLSRNQVSNWFINARVRLWKPMVEEIHMLETKGLTEMDLNSSKNNGTQPATSDQGLSSLQRIQQEQQSAKSSNFSMVELPSNSRDCQSSELWHAEKRSRMEPSSSGASVVGGVTDLAPYQSGFDMGRLGAVSLTLGLRQDDGAWQQQYQQMRPYFERQMVHD